MLSFSLPKKAFTTGASAKVEKNKMVESIISNISKTFKTNSDGTADLFLLCKNLGLAPFELSEEEKTFMNVKQKVHPAKPAIKCLEEFF